MRGAGLWNIWVQGVQILNKCAGAFRQISGIVCKDNIGCDIAVFNRSAYNSFFLNQRGGRLRDNTDPHAHFHKIKGRTGIVIDTEPVRTQVLVLNSFRKRCSQRRYTISGSFVRSSSVMEEERSSAKNDSCPTATSESVNSFLQVSESV